MPPVKHLFATSTFLIGGLLFTAAPAGAQTREQRAGARSAAEAGGDAFDAGKYAEAADLFERAERLVHAPPHLLYAARSHAKLGHLVEARELYLTLTREQLAPGAPKVFKDAVQAGEKELADLEPRLPYVSVVVQGSGGATNVQVTRNGQPMAAELVGIPAPVNPGEYSYQATADGMESTATTVKLAEGGRETVVLTLRNIPGARKKSPPPAKGSASGQAGSTSSVGGSLTDGPPSDSPSSGGRPYLIASIAGFGVGAVGVGVGTYFIVSSLDPAKQADDLFADCQRRVPRCEKGSDDAKEVDRLDGIAQDKQTVAAVSYVVGGAGIAAGVVFLLMDAHRGPAAFEPRLRPVVAHNYVGLAGTF
jgi:hypothetical protein